MHRSLATFRTLVSSISTAFRLVHQAGIRLSISISTITILLALVPSMQIWIMGTIIDQITNLVTQNSDKSLWALSPFFGIQLLLLVLSTAGQSLSTIMQELLQEKVSYKVQTDIIHRAAKLSLEEVESSDYYDRLQRAQQESAHRPTVILMHLTNSLAGLVTLVSMLVILLQLSAVVTAICLLAPIPVFLNQIKYGTMGYSLMRYQSPSRRVLFYLSHIATTDWYSKDVRVFGFIPQLLRKYSATFSDLYNDSKSLLISKHSSIARWSTISSLVTTGVGLYAASKAALGVVSVGSFTIYTQAAIQLQSSFRALLSSLQGIHENSLYLATYQEFVGKSPNESPVSFPENGIAPKVSSISFETVGYRYPGGGVDALHDVSFSASQGQIIAVLGKNGSGKSTLMKLISGLYEPDKGRIMINDVDSRDVSPVERTRYTSALFQDYSRFQLSLRDNILLKFDGSGKSDDEIMTTLNRASAQSVLMGLTSGLDTPLGLWFDGGVELSGGQWQKVALARAYHKLSQILILDEPASGLDPDSESELMREIVASKLERITFLVTHKFSAAKAADLVLFFHNGTIVEMGTHDELWLKKGRYHQMFELQANAYR